MPILRYKKYPENEFRAHRLNTHALAEVLTGDDSAFFSDLEIFLDSKQDWKCLSQAFKDGDVITDNYNTIFRESKNTEERERGWFD
jgi:hypothetical protein